MWWINQWSVLQYVIIRPAVSIAGIVTQALGVLCESQGFDIHFANVYLEAVDFVSISVALYGLIVFYGLTRNDLKGKKPLAKFLCIKLIVMFTWYQSFVFSALQNRVIHATSFWTSTNIADGLNALAICIEMIFFSIFMWLAYPYNEYKRKSGTPPTSIWRPLWDSINYSDFAQEIISSLMFFILPKKWSQRTPPAATFDSAFNIDGHRARRRHTSSGSMSRGPSDDLPLADYSDSSA